ncbi:Protein red1 [Penicillium rolfsii]|nr:Protein red1 [Penicillium rolfsii]
MSNQPPPPFGGQPNYAQQWPPPFPFMVPPNFAPISNSQAGAPPPLVHPSQSFEYNLASANANSRIPVSGNSGDQAIFPPPHLPFMGQFDLSQFVMPFPSMAMSSFGVPPQPAPPGSSVVPSGSTKSDGAAKPNFSGSQHPAREALSPSDPKSEEGEVSEGEIRQSVNTKPARIVRLSGASAPQPSSLEEGETVSSPTSTSTRSSSPYNPPLSVSADAVGVNGATKWQKEDTSTISSEVSPPPKSAAQLRVQAQGALLSLAPHNIRYNELVAEGINPVILKQLYEDVGIRIATPQPTKPAVVAPIDKTAKFEASVQAKTPKEPTQLAKNNVLQKPSPSADLSGTGKPMERKELIAKMLAAKAAKAAQPTISKQASEESQPAATAPSSSSTPSIEKAKENGATVKEKNKAQTELARQRIEALKKQALLKSQQRAQQLSQASKEAQPSVLPNSVPAVHHPLPVRPPAPQPPETAGIPGLSLTELNPDVQSQTPSAGPAGITVDATPLARANQRKRPLASDFNDAGTTQKKHFQSAAPHAIHDSDKLIIHISDDESLYGDDEGEDMDVDSSPDQDPAPVTISTPLSTSRPPLQKSLSGTWASTSTPQAPSSSGDQEQMRQKNLEIQALHRKIAELEERRKAKLAASRTQSPHILDDSAASPSAPASADSAAELVETPPATLAPEVSQEREAPTTSKAAIAVRLNETDSLSPSSVKILALMDNVQLDTFRCKILRIREIGQGLADSNTETVSSDSNLALCLEEADNLLQDVTEEKEERLRFINELKNLSHEINGLTAADMNELRRQAKMKEQELATQKVPTITAPVAVAKDITMSDADTSSAKEEVAVVPASHGSDSDFIATDRTNVDTVSSSGAGGLLAASQPGSTGPVLEESEGRSSSDESSSGDSSSSKSSSDESSSDVDSASDAELEASDAEEMAESVQMADDDQMQIDPPDLPLPNQPPVEEIVDGENDEDSEDDEESEDVEEDEDVQADEAVGEDADDYQPTDNNDQEGVLSDAESEAYEPPEPETGAESPHSTYSPPPPAPLEDTTNLEPLLDLSQIGEPLTETPRVSFLEARPVYQGSDAEILGVKAPSKTSVPGFTPYVSPMRYFKAYRYHPRYTEEVSDGYRSLTFSNEIDPMKYLCPYELAGGVCNDRSCEFQHFRDMNLSASSPEWRLDRLSDRIISFSTPNIHPFDAPPFHLLFPFCPVRLLTAVLLTLTEDKILIQLGSVREGNTEEEKETYLAGLKEIINEMRRDKVKDFNTVASEIVAYRRRFLQDPSRVLPL